MSSSELQQLKMAWLAAKATHNTQEQLRILRDYPQQQDALIDFIAAYHATGGDEVADQDATILTVTQRGQQAALERVFASQAQFATLVELRKSQSISKSEAARGLRLSLDVWDKFESGAIELISLSQRQLDRLAQFFHVSIDQFGMLLGNSQPTMGLNRRQTREAARNRQQGPRKQSFAEAIARSTMNKEDKDFWLE